jgi:protoporphyrinogen/coproporphyrinogen III oxidase
MTKTRSVDGLVLGGGIAGLVATRELLGFCGSVELLESSERLGGSIGSIEIAGIRVDSGAEAFAITRPDTELLLQELGLAEKVIAPDRSDARIKSPRGTFLIPHGIFGIPSSLSDPLLLDAVGETAVALAKEFDSRPWDQSCESSLGEMVRVRLGADFVDRLVSPVVSGVHAADPDFLDANTIVPGLAAAARGEGSLVGAVAKMRGLNARPGAAIKGIRGGLYQLIDAVEEELRSRGVKIKTSTTAKRAVFTSGRWLVETEDGQSISARYLVSALPANRAAKVFDEKSLLAQSLADIRTLDVALVLIVIRDPTLNDYPLGSGVLVQPGVADVVAKASTHVNAKWSWVEESLPADHHLLRFSYGRDGVLPNSSLDLIETALSDARRLYGSQAVKAVDARVVQWPGSLVHATPHHSLTLRELHSSVLALPGLAVVGSGVGSNGITGLVADIRKRIPALPVE